MPKYSSRAQKNHSYATEARSRPQRPGSLQEQPQDSMGVNVEPPVLASMTLAHGETVYVELSSEGQRRMREGTIVELANSDVAARHRDEHGIKWMSLNRLERLREAEARSCRDLPLQQYAALLCEAIRDYDFPAVTYDFTEEKPLHHDSMLAVEQYIGTLLRSTDFSAVKDGLSNVLYWGYAQQPGRGDFKVRDFRKTIPEPEREPKLDKFAQLMRSGQADLSNIKKLQLRQFSQISFVSKILMFLDPTRCPVLDLKIANAFAKSSFLPLQNLTFAKGGIRITERNATAYDTWACWCRDIATVVNEAPVSPCRGVRAVDVERALFTLVDSQATDKARMLLDGPTGWTFDRR